MTLFMQTAKALDAEQSDSVKTYHINEVVITSSTKETNDPGTLPGSATIISPQDIRSMRIDAIKNLSALVPNLHIPDYGSRLTSAIYIRGVGTRSSGQSVGLYVDNVPYPDKSAFDFELAGIQRIEVLRGPQGTLYGRNAMGGIVNIYTLSPFDYQGARITLTAGNYGQLRAKAAFYAKPSATLGLSLDAFYSRNDGYFDNAFTSQKADNEESAGGRFKLEWRPLTQFSAAYTTAIDHVNQGAFPYGLYHRETGDIDPVNIGAPSSYRRNMITQSLMLEYRAERFTINSATGHQYFDDDMKMDQDFSPKTLFTLNQKQRQRAFSEEITIKGNAQGNYRWSLGVYAFTTGLHTEGPVTFGEDGVKEILQPVFDRLKADNPRMPALTVMDDTLHIPGSFDTPSRGAAIFHQSTLNNLLTHGLSITAGLRIDYETQRMDYRSTARMRMGMSAGGTTAEIPGIALSVMDVSTTQNFRQALPKLSLKYEFTPLTFAYLSAAKGYKTGGYNVQMSADLMQSLMQYDMMSKFAPAMAVEPEPVEKVAAYRPEYSWNYETGLRSSLLENKLSGEITLFYTDIRDMQITRFVESGNGRILANAGRARSLGLEASLKASLAQGLTAAINYGLTHATFLDYVHEQKTDGEILRTDCRGNYVPYIPAHTLSAAMHYTKLLRHSWLDQFTASANLTASGAIRWTELNDISQPLYALLNAKAGVRRGVVSLDLWASNLTNTIYSAFYFESFGNPYVQKGKPLRLGLDLAITF
jgi:outer membrane receptor protein involved in Fe transport